MMSVDINGRVYKAIMNAARQTVAKGLDAKPVITGVLLEVDKEGARFTALDGYRLAHWFVSSIDETRESWSCVMPVVHIICKKDDLLTLSYDNGRISVLNNRTTMAIYMNSQYIKKILMGLNAIYDHSPVKLEFSKSAEGPLKPMIISKCDDPAVKFTGIILPIRVSQDGVSDEYDVSL